MNEHRCVNCTSSRLGIGLYVVASIGGDGWIADCYDCGAQYGPYRSFDEAVDVLETGKTTTSSEL